MRCFFLLVLYFLASSAVWGQKMLLIEKANRAKTTKLYIGESLRFRLSGEENYWYNRTITDILPESNTLLLDNFAVKLDSIAVIKVSRKRIWRITGSTLFAFGASLALATTVGKVLYNDKSVDAIPLYSVSALSLGTGWFLGTPRKLRLGKRHRLRIIEIKFPEPLIPPPLIKRN